MPIEDATVIAGWGLMPTEVPRAATRPDRDRSRRARFIVIALRSWTPERVLEWHADRGVELDLGAGKPRALALTLPQGRRLGRAADELPPSLRGGRARRHPRPWIRHVRPGDTT
jgi:hypothetical protein